LAPPRGARATRRLPPALCSTRSYTDIEYGRGPGGPPIGGLHVRPTTAKVRPRRPTHLADVTNRPTTRPAPRVTQLNALHDGTLGSGHRGVQLSVRTDCDRTGSTSLPCDAAQGPALRGSYPAPIAASALGGAPPLPRTTIQSRSRGGTVAGAAPHDSVAIGSRKQIPQSGPQTLKTYWGLRSIFANFSIFFGHVLQVFDLKKEPRSTGR
jgi:hypothetical protein